MKPENLHPNLGEGILANPTTFERGILANPTTVQNGLPSPDEKPFLPEG